MVGFPPNDINLHQPSFLLRIVIRVYLYRPDESVVLKLRISGLSVIANIEAIIHFDLR